MNRVEEARSYAEIKHKGQKRIGGLPYITHPEAVAEILSQRGMAEEYIIAALFHDLLEDTDATEAEIEAIGGPEVLEAVKLLTKQKGYVMDEYVGAIKNNPIAFAVKGADRLHNLRCAVCTGDDFKRRYVLESLDWYMDFMPEIPEAVRALAESMDTRLTELPFLYEPVECWHDSGKSEEVSDES